MRVVGFRLAVLTGFLALPLVVLGQLNVFAGTVSEPSPLQSLAVAASTTTTTNGVDNQTATTGPPPTGSATTDEPSPGTTSKLEHELRGEAALSKISFPWRSQLPGWTIEFHESRSGVLGYTYTNEKRIEIYVRDSMTERLLTHVIAHELGHAVDVTLNNGADRREWLRIRGLEDSDWWPAEGGVSDFHSGAGDFAEGFAAWQVGTSSYRSKLGPAPNSEQLEFLAALATR